MNKRILLANGFRLLWMSLLVFCAIQQQAFAADPAPTGGVLVEMGQKLLGIVFTVGGIAAAVGGGIIGIRLIIGSAAGSSHTVSHAVMAAMGLLFGFAMVIGGPALAQMIVDGMASVPKTIPQPTP